MLKSSVPPYCEISKFSSGVKKFGTTEPTKGFFFVEYWVKKIVLNKTFLPTHDFLLKRN